MGGLTQKVKNLFARPDEDLPIKDDPKLHYSIENQSQVFGKKEPQKENFDDEKLKRIQSVSQQVEKQISCPVRMLSMMQGKQYNTQPYKSQQKQIEEILSELS
ncbi:unnamed protein product [Paramecium octaurelia]|uniref:Uncharacterized protein n=1 Tax=Paramecium octaurelia TaxID=43137 RepID=A0A8S1V3N1_PAROT|nr:unnamed protein product [Paramecium octaurelia]